MSREKLPSRRRCWTQKVRIDNQTFYLTCGHYDDGRLGEVFLEAHKEGSFARGVLSALARMTSVALQSGASIEDVVKALKGLNFPPRGLVEGSGAVGQCMSITDWVAREIEDAYLSTPKPTGAVATGSGF